MPDPIIDPLGGPAYGVHGRIVTMDQDHTVVPEGVIWIEAGTIRALTRQGESLPPGFEEAPVMRTGGTIYPGMIELHNHLPYNVLQMWDVPERFGNRDQWGRHDDYRRLVSGPMKILGKTAGYIEAVIRYVEVKALVAGVTTSQGIALYSNANTRRYHRGLVRNVEETNDPHLPEADTRVADIDADGAESFLRRLERGKKIILHLAEGVDDTARGHFQALQLESGPWAITEALVGIHSAGLIPDDLEIFGSHGGSMVWSPASNLMLYGGTARVDDARRKGVAVALGSDWAPTGSKNLLAELKVAQAAAGAFGWDLDCRDLVDMVTHDAASVVGWGEALGSIGPGRRADLLVLHGRRKADPYRQLLEASERTVILVIVNGVPRYGQARFISPDSESLRVGGSDRRLFLEQESVDPVVAGLTFGQAVERLHDGLSRLPELARALEEAAGVTSAALGGTRGVEPATALGIPRAGQRWVIELQEEEADATTVRPGLGAEPGLLPLGAPRTAEPLSELLEPLTLDPLTVVDDPGYRRRLRGQGNLPESVAALL